MLFIESEAHFTIIVPRHQLEKCVMSLLLLANVFLLVCKFVFIDDRFDFRCLERYGISRDDLVMAKGRSNWSEDDMAEVMWFRVEVTHACMHLTFMAGWLLSILKFEYLFIGSRKVSLYYSIESLLANVPFCDHVLHSYLSSSSAIVYCQH